MNLREIIQIATAESLGIVILLPSDELRNDEEDLENEKKDKFLNFDSLTAAGGGSIQDAILMDNPGQL